MLLLKFDAGGTLQWASTAGDTGMDVGYCVQETSDGDFIITGATTNYGAGNYDTFLVKYDSNGIHLWSRTAGGSGDEV